MQLREEKIQQIIDLIGKRLRGELTVDEEAFLVDWAAESDENRQLFDELNDAIYRSQELRRMAEYTDAETALTNFLNNYTPGLTVHKNHFVKRFVVAAAAVAAIVFGVWFMTSESGSLKQVQGDVVVNDIAPGKNTATLTLANGKKIVLSDALKGELAEEAGVKITKTSEGQIIYDLSSSATMKDLDPSELGMTNTLSTARGETYEVILPDKSHVWLNAASSITYPASFAGLKERKVSLEGEAYFEVFKNKAQAFVVSTKKQDVTVLGTHFNINSYDDEVSVKTTLLEGSVLVSSSRQSVARRDLSSGGKDLSILRDDGGEKTIVLKPNQQSTLLRTGQLKVTEVDTEEAVAWKNGMFLFEEEGLESIMKKISRWYDVDVVYEDLQSAKEVFAGGITRYESVSKVLRMLEKAGDVKFKIEGRKITVMK